MKSEMSATFRSFMRALPAIAITTLLAVSFAGSIQSVQWLNPAL